MKTKKLSRKLAINKETVANLEESQLKDVKGGETHILPTVAETCSNTCKKCL